MKDLWASYMFGALAGRQIDEPLSSEYGRDYKRRPSFVPRGPSPEEQLEWLRELRERAQESLPEVQRRIRRGDKP